MRRSGPHRRKRPRSWARVTVARQDIAAAERWLRELNIRFVTNAAPAAGRYTICLAPSDAVLLKLRWG